MLLSWHELKLICIGWELAAIKRVRPMLIFFGWSEREPSYIWQGHGVTHELFSMQPLCYVFCRVCIQHRFLNWSSLFRYRLFSNQTQLAVHSSERAHPSWPWSPWHPWIIVWYQVVKPSTTIASYWNLVDTLICNKILFFLSFVHHDFKVQ